MTTLLTSELIDRCHAGSRNKGFWDETPPQGQQLMLVISELAESLEAHRKGHRCLLGSSSSLFYPEMPAELFVGEFLKHAKDTVEDELADAYIRLCDFAGGFKLDVEALIATESEWYDLFGGVGANFAEALLSISHDVSTAWINDFETAKEVPLGTAMAEIKSLCDREGIDLLAHINAKLRYNATRPAKHGKAY